MKISTPEDSQSNLKSKRSLSVNSSTLDIYNDDEILFSLNNHCSVL